MNDTIELAAAPEQAVTNGHADEQPIITAAQLLSRSKPKVERPYIAELGGRIVVTQLRQSQIREIHERHTHPQPDGTNKTDSEKATREFIVASLIEPKLDLTDIAELLNEGSAAVVAQIEDAVLRLNRLGKYREAAVEDAFRATT